jgi:hypothetical protein
MLKPAHQQCVPAQPSLNDGSWANLLTFYPLREYGSEFFHSDNLDAWFWTPNQIPVPADDSVIDSLTRAGWEDTGVFLTEQNSLVPFLLYGQLAEVRFIRMGRDYHLWTLTADRERAEHLPVMLTCETPQVTMKPVGRTLPPAHFGKRAVILQEKPVRCSMTKLPQTSQELQARLGAALDQLDGTPDLPAETWIAAWQEIQQMARRLAADYWSRFQDTHVERPKPINVWRDNHTLAPLTMIQEGAQVSIHHSSGWEWGGHMIENSGPLQGATLPRYVYTTGKHRENRTEYWMQHPEDAEIPINPDLALQEVLKHLEARTDRDGDIFCSHQCMRCMHFLRDYTKSH